MLVESLNEEFGYEAPDWAYEYMRQKYIRYTPPDEWIKEWERRVVGGLPADSIEKEISEEEQRRREEIFKKDIQREARFYRENFNNMQEAIEYDKSRKLEIPPDWLETSKRTPTKI
jgi:hypothetical protein